MPSPSSEFRAGIQAELPILVGVVPFGLIYGTIAVQLGIPGTVAQAMSSVIFAGSAQLVSLPLVAATTPGLVILLTVFIVNLRHALYSASIAPYLQHLRPFWKVLLAYLLTDEAYAVVISHYRVGGDASHKHWYFLGAGLALWLCWQSSTALGLFLGSQIPSSWGLDFAVPLTFTAIVVPMIKNRAQLGAAIVAGGVGALTIGLPYRLGLIMAALMGIVTGMILDRVEVRDRSLQPSPKEVEMAGDR